MAAPTVLMNEGFVLLSPSVTGWSIDSQEQIRFGKVEIVATGYTFYAVNDIVAYNADARKSFVYNEDEYYIVPVEELYFKETTPP